MSVGSASTNISADGRELLLECTYCVLKAIALEFSKVHVNNAL